MKLRWFLSGTVRQATDLAKHVHKLLCAQRDILPPQAVQALEISIAQLNGAINSDADKETLEKQMAELEKAGNKWLKPYPNAGWRENIEVLLVAIAVAMAIRTFFIQPFKIPTGSMQPTLFGVTYENLAGKPDYQIPSLPRRIFDAVIHGTFYHDVKAEADGSVVEIQRPRGFGINLRTIIVQYADCAQPTPITIWFAPDEDPNRLSAFTQYSGVVAGQTFKKGDSILKYRETTGDHLFVDRVTYNFRHPKRGEIVVFKTHGIDKLIEATQGTADNQFYIKRLVGLPGERISIGEDRHIRANGVRLDASTPHFEHVYGFDPKSTPKESQYSGHWPFDPSGRPWSLFDPEFQIREKHYLVFGDNTMNSLDSRYWGDFPQENVIGRSCFVYWPISERFGWGQQ